jgi:hypothetical protein
MKVFSKQISFVFAVLACALAVSAQEDGVVNEATFKGNALAPDFRDALLEQDRGLSDKYSMDVKDKCGKRCGHASNCDSTCPLCVKSSKHSKHGRCEEDSAKETDKCGASCRSDSQCDTTCSKCKKDKDPWGGEMKKGTCVAVQETDKCGASCRKDSQCDTTCSKCKKDKDPWGEEMKKGTCVAVQETDKCGLGCKRDSQCDSTCPYCKKDKNVWGEDSNRGTCSPKSSGKSTGGGGNSSKVSENCHCKQGKRYCHNCSMNNKGQKKCKYQRSGDCNLDQGGNWWW